MAAVTLPQQVFLTIPSSDYHFINTLSQKMGWTIRKPRKSGLQKAMEDVAAGRIYYAKDGADLINQCLQ